GPQTITMHSGGGPKRTLRDQHKLPILDNPLTLPANSVMDGLIEFPVRDAKHLEEMRADIEQYGLILRVTERRSHLTKELRLGRSFDAHRQRLYRGSLGHPLDTLQMRWKLYQRTRNWRDLLRR